MLASLMFSSYRRQGNDLAENFVKTRKELMELKPRYPSRIEETTLYRQLFVGRMRSLAIEQDERNLAETEEILKKQKLSQMTPQPQRRSSERSRTQPMARERLRDVSQSTRSATPRSLSTSRGSTSTLRTSLASNSSVFVAHPASAKRFSPTPVSTSPIKCLQFKLEPGEEALVPLSDIAPVTEALAGEVKINTVPLNSSSNNNNLGELVTVRKSFLLSDVFTVPHRRHRSVDEMSYDAEIEKIMASGDAVNTNSHRYPSDFSASAPYNNSGLGFAELPDALDSILNSMDSLTLRD